MAWSAEQRHLFIDFRLYWDGFVNRRDLTEAFGISAPQAAKDFRAYNDAYPENMAYDPKTKKYWESEDFKPRLYTPDALDLLENRPVLQPVNKVPLTSAPLPIAHLPLPHRKLDATTVRSIYRAIRDNTGLTINYQSMTSADPKVRTILPHSFASDGFRWHVRAWDGAKGTYADFVIARISAIEGWPELPPPEGPDHAWSETATLEIRPNGQFSRSQIEALKADYGMADGTPLKIAVPRALLFYLLNALHLDFDGPEKPVRAHPLVVENRDEIARILHLGDGKHDT